ncbi:hypothetical protein D0851_14145 [Marinobacter sp. Arc7-DN-1]|nr:hypothetical protein D0851_14145 [Marinobacter sp. Arc7-DN-1]
MVGRNGDLFMIRPVPGIGIRRQMAETGCPSWEKGYLSELSKPIWVIGGSTPINNSFGRNFDHYAEENLRTYSS